MADSFAGELAARPRAFLVHDPARSRCLEKVTKDNAAEMLFFDAFEVRQAETEYSGFLKELRDEGFEVIDLLDCVSETYAAAISSNPNSIYMRDPLVTLPWAADTCVVGSMKEPVRQPEKDIGLEAAKYLGFSKIINLPPNLTLEGGDVYPLVIDGKRTLVVHIGNRTDEKAAFWLFYKLGNAVDQLALVQTSGEVLHLDSALGFIGTNAAVIDEGAGFSDVRLVLHTGERQIGFREFIGQFCDDVRSVSHREADFEQQTNILHAGTTCLVFNNHNVDKCKTLISKELIHGRGGPRCLTRPLY